MPVRHGGADEAYPLDTSKWDFEMPDRSTLDVAYERCHIPELLFNPSVLRTTPPALPKAATGRRRTLQQARPSRRYGA